MHGEYKIPGGKLVVVDLEVQGGQLCHVELSGDFFLEPDEALSWMTLALEGAPADASEADLAARIQDATKDAELLGVTPQGVAVAVRRALNEGAA